MKKGYHILLIFAMFLFFSCDSSPLLQEIPTINDSLKEGTLKKGRNSKAKLEYSINEKRSRQLGFDYPFMMHANLVNDTLIFNYNGELRDANILIKDSNNEVVIDERLVLINKEKVNIVYPTDSFPYFIEITSPDADVNGIIKLVEDDDEE